MECFFGGSYHIQSALGHFRIDEHKARDPRKSEGKSKKGKKKRFEIRLSPAGLKRVESLPDQKNFTFIIASEWLVYSRFTACFIPEKVLHLILHDPTIDSLRIDQVSVGITFSLLSSFHLFGIVSIVDDQIESFLGNLSRA
jgi:hypothetical protein